MFAQIVDDIITKLVESYDTKSKQKDGSWFQLGRDKEFSSARRSEIQEFKTQALAINLAAYENDELKYINSVIKLISDTQAQIISTKDKHAQDRKSSWTFISSGGLPKYLEKLKVHLEAIQKFFVEYNLINRPNDIKADAALVVVRHLALYLSELYVEEIAPGSSWSDLVARPCHSPALKADKRELAMNICTGIFPDRRLFAPKTSSYDTQVITLFSAFKTRFHEIMGKHHAVSENVKWAPGPLGFIPKARMSIFGISIEHSGANMEKCFESIEKELVSLKRRHETQETCGAAEMIVSPTGALTEGYSRVRMGLATLDEPEVSAERKEEFERILKRYMDDAKEKGASSSLSVGSNN